MSDTGGRQQAHLAPDYATPRIIIGAWQFSAGHNVEPTDTENALDTLAGYANAGLSTFDCADIYTGVEELLGEFLRRFKTSVGQEQDRQVRIHTKYVPDRDALPRLSKESTERIIDRSLRRLGVEQLDLVQFAWWDYNIPGYVDCAVWLNELKSAGKIRNVGVTNFDVPTLSEIVDAGVPVVSQQVQYSLLDHRPENGLVEFCENNGIQLLCYGTLAGGFLSNRWLGEPEPATGLANRSLTKYKLMIDEFGGWDSYQELLGALDSIAKKHGVSIGNVATRYVLDRRQVAAAIVGVHNKEHLQDNLRTVALELDEEDNSRLRDFAVHRSKKGDVFALERNPDSAHASIMRYNLNQEKQD
jgi:aryl-alcohol dehydrogenase-like predicted oxidoreductase